MGIAFLGGISGGEPYGIVSGSMWTVGSIWLAAAVTGALGGAGPVSFAVCSPGIIIGYGGGLLFGKMAKDEYLKVYEAEVEKYGWEKKEVENAGKTITGLYSPTGNSTHYEGLTVNDPNIWREKGYKVLYEGDGEWSVRKPE
jgi:hypothetical protein